MPLVDNTTSTNDKNYIELDFLSDLVAEYEEKYYPLEKPTLNEVIKLRMFEMGLSQTKLSELLGISVFQNQ